jgi:hypothetical protein
MHGPQKTVMQPITIAGITKTELKNKAIKNQFTNSKNVSPDVHLVYW